MTKKTDIVVSFDGNKVAIGDLPGYSIYKNLSFSKSDVKIWGYFLDLSEKGDLLDFVTSMLRKRDWSSLANISAQFLFFVFFENPKTLFVLTDLYGSFPVFLGRVKDKLFISTHAEHIVDRLPLVTFSSFPLLQMIVRESYLGLDTIVKEMKQVPPGCVLEVNSELKPRVSTYLTGYIDSDLQKKERYHSVKEFADDLLSTLGRISKSYTRTVGKSKYSVDLTSGLDSTLVAYSFRKTVGKPVFATTIDTPSRLIEDNLVLDEFSRVHDLDHHYIHTEEENYLFTEEFFAWEKFPHPFMAYTVGRYLSQLQKIGIKVDVTGHGGNELYSGKSIKDKYPHLAYLAYFDQVADLSKGAKEVLSAKGLEVVLNRSEYSRLDVFPSFPTRSAMEAMMSCFTSKWETDICLLSPLSDPRVIKLFWQVPQMGDGEDWSSRSFWNASGIKGIYVLNQLEERHPPEILSRDRGFVNGRSQFIVDELSKSPLRNSGLFKIDSIVKSFKNGEINKLTEYDSIFYLINLVKTSRYIRKLKEQKEVDFE